MKIVLERRECKIKVSPDCTGTFDREPSRGRPPIACYICREMKPKGVKSTGKASASSRPIEAICGCGATFPIPAGRGRAPSKCAECRESGKVYRMNDDGLMEEIRQDVIKAEQQERKDQAGRERAENLFFRMQILHQKRRSVIER